MIDLNPTGQQRGFGFGHWSCCCLKIPFVKFEYLNTLRILAFHAKFSKEILQFPGLPMDPLKTEDSFDDQIYYDLKW